MNRNNFNFGLFRTILVGCFVLLVANAKAGEIVWTQYLNGTNIAQNKEMRMSDFILRSAYNNSEYDYKVSLVYGRENRKDFIGTGNESGTYTVNYTIEFLNTSFNVIHQTSNSLQISFDPSNPGASIYDAHNIFTAPNMNYERVRLVITNDPGTGIPTDVRLELALISKSGFDFTGTAPVTGFQTTEKRLYWSYIKGADYYQVEWVHVDNEDDHVAFTTNEDPFLYKEPVRILVKEQYYDQFSFTYPKGVVYFRIRGAGRYTGVTSSSEKYTPWYYVGSYTIGSTFESLKNWQYVVSYAEDGKYKKIMTYYDGTLRNRQAQINLSSENIIIGAETKYDFEGRPAVNILPVPIEESKWTTLPRLSYLDNMNSFSGGKAGYDKTMITNQADALTSGSQASKYYSSSNAQVNNGAMAYLPDAGGYPFTQTLYTRDGTGRPLRQGGVGQPFHLSDPTLGGKNTAYKYSTANDTELRRLFGTNVGEAIHYKKNYMIDPNGQISVSYQDQENRVIATCLTGNTPTNVNSLASNVVTPMTVSLNSSNVIDKANRISKSVSMINNILENTQYTFDYDLNGVINQSQLLASYCKECTYDLVFTIKDPDDLVVYTTTVNNIAPTTPVTGCTEDDYLRNTLIHTTQTFAKSGTYQVIKELRLSSTALELLLQDIETKPGFPTYSTFEQTYVSNINISNCDLTCEEQCRSEIIRRHTPAWVSNPANATALANEIAAYIQSFCPAYTQSVMQDVTLNECKSIYDQMEEQIRPGGIYNPPTSTAWITGARAAIMSNGGFKDANGVTLTIQPEVADLISANGFNDDWVDELVGRHREYCHYQNCVRLTPSRNFDKTMATVKDWNEAVVKSYVGSGLSPLDKPDPMFDPVFNNSDAATAQARTTVLNKLNSYTSASSLMFLDVNSNGSVSLEEFVSSYVPYGTNTSYVPDATAKWSLYRSLYNGLKVEEERKLIGAVASSYALPGSIYADLQAPGYQGCPYTADANTIITDPTLPNTLTSVNQVNDQNMMANCQGMCPENATVWVSMIENNCGILSQTDRTNIYNYFLAYCNGSCGYKNPFGLVLNENINDGNLVAIQNILDNTFGYAACSIANLVSVENPYTTSCEFGVKEEYWTLPVTPGLCAQGVYQIPSGVSPNYEGVRGNFNLNNSTNTSVSPAPGINNDYFMGRYSSTLEVPATGDYVFQLTFDNSVDFYVDGVKLYAGEFHPYYICFAVTPTPPHTTLPAPPYTVQVICNGLTAGFHSLQIVHAQGEGNYRCELKWKKTSESSFYEIAPSHLLVPGSQTICSINGIKECPLDLNSDNDCTNDPIFISTCGEKVLNAINTLIAHSALNNPHACNRTTYPLVLNQPENVNVSGCSGFTTQSMIEIPASCNGSGQDKILVVKENGVFKLVKGSSAAAYQTACACDPGAAYYPGGTNIQEIKFYTYVSGSPVYIANSDIAYIKDPFVDCQYVRENLEPDFKSSYGVAVKLGKMNGSVITEITAYVEAALYNGGGNNLMWKVPGLPARTLCNNTFTIDMPQMRNDCIDRLTAIAKLDAYNAWEAAKDEFISKFINEKVDKCFDSPFHEDLYYSYSSNEYHYTLYYYDQAGNLVQTVPPEGVKPLTVANNPTVFTSTGVYLDSPTNQPEHILVTKYRYNSLNQLCWQNTPDGGETYFWYDSKGQLRLSQNAKQFAESNTPQNPNKHKYSYTRYDRQGRIEEVGQLEDHVNDRTYMTTLSNEKDILATLDDRTFPTVSGSELKQITTTLYDVGDSQQDNLRGRVAVTSSKSTETSTDVITRYSYDPYGNVKSLRQDITGFAVKQTDYEYDVISKKVNKVYYQKGQTDQFVHQYEYDSDNRIKSVLTSFDDMTWEEDAHYFYYPHGPLARVELGQDKVQGLDYYYTLQGRLKGVNIPALRTEVGAGSNKARNIADIGLDGVTNVNNLNQYVGQDEYSYALAYFNGDYAPINSGKYLQAADNTNMWGMVFSNIKEDGLYNGNIVAMITQIHSMGDHTLSGGTFANRQKEGLKLNTYQYDQLNRLTHSIRYGFDDGTRWTYRNPGTTNTAPYDARYTYDANGNILTATINGQSGASLMDNLTYNYNTNTAGLINNRLNYVQDPSGVTEGTDLPSTQALNNYQYDAIGNLTSDASEGITDISWSMYGKVLSVLNNTSDADLAFIYDAAGNRVKKVSTISSGTTTTYYIHDASKNIIATYEFQSSATTIEHNLYGIGRLGVIEESAVINGIYLRKPSLRQYELSNHLGNVLVTIDGMKIGIDTDADTDADYYTPIALTGQEYYPFGMTIPGRNFGTGYRFGFNGQEKDNDWNSNYVFEYRIHDPRLGRFLSVDPLSAEYPWNSNYAFAENDVIRCIDLEGNEREISVFENYHLVNTLPVLTDAYRLEMYNSVLSQIRQKTAKFGRGGGQYWGTDGFNAKGILYQSFLPDGTILYEYDPEDPHWDFKKDQRISITYTPHDQADSRPFNVGGLGVDQEIELGDKTNTKIIMSTQIIGHTESEAVLYNTLTFEQDISGKYSFLQKAFPEDKSKADIFAYIYMSGSDMPGWKNLQGSNVLNTSIKIAHLKLSYSIDTKALAAGDLSKWDLKIGVTAKRGAEFKYGEKNRVQQTLGKVRLK